MREPSPGRTMDIAESATRLDVSAVLAYAAKGWPVLPVAGIADGCSCGRPCDSPAKHPLTRHGVHDASTDSARIRRWWDRWPEANVGIATGAASGVAVVDVDPGSGGRHSLDAIRAAGQDLDPTLLAFTGGGGFHLFSGCRRGSASATPWAVCPASPSPCPGSTYEATADT